MVQHGRKRSDTDRETGPTGHKRFFYIGTQFLCMAEQVEGAILQRDGSTYAVMVRSPGGLVSPELLERVAAIARKYRVDKVKITSGQRLDLIGVRAEDLAAVFEDLGPDAVRRTGPCVRYVRSCPGIQNCKNGTQDSLALALEIEAKYRELPFPAKLKIGISGCPRCCGDSRTRDIGIMGSKDGWTVLFGGNSGTKPRFGDVLATNLTTEEVHDLVARLLEYFRVHAKPRERTSRFMERITMEELQNDLLNRIPYIPLVK
jgi:NAD(P)H-nitrite reductase large subunit